jgi:3-phosphoshikimate 1-carboxyvinyltransferase
VTGAPWPAPSAYGPLDAVVAVPGSKSVTNRALVLAALASSPTTLRRPLRSRDTQLMAAGLRALGADIRDVPIGADESEPPGTAAWHVLPGPIRAPADIDCGLAGTVMRFLPPLATLAEGPVRFDGDPRARERPMRPLLNALRDLDARVDDDGRGSLPFTIHGGEHVRGGAVKINASASSQFVSALLLTGAAWEHGVAVHQVGPRLPSRPHVAMTVHMLRAAGAGVDDSEPGVWRVHPSRLHGADLTIEPDLSNAAPFLAAAMATGGTVVVRDWPRQTTQAGDALRDLLPAMGATCHWVDAGLMLTGTGRICGIDVDLGEVGELVPVLTALAALADSPSTLRGIAHLRGHETDRLAALARELTALGGDVTEHADGLTIRPRTLRADPARAFATYEDHRLATAAAVLGLRVPGLRVENVETTAKTLPGFPRLWETLVIGADGDRD